MAKHALHTVSDAGRRKVIPQPGNPKRRPRVLLGMDARTARFVAVAVAATVLFAACAKVGSSATPGAVQTGGSGSTGGGKIHFYTGTPGPADLPAPGGPKSLIPLDQIISGGPPPDGIPPIDEPKFLAPDKATFLAPNEPVLAVSYQGQSKAYPLRIITWHEVVNDTLGGSPVTVTFCPLCNTGIAFLRPTIQGKLLDFGTSGKLFDSNLLMYDRETRTLWSQAIGQAVAGQLTGTRLTFLAAQILSWADWKAANPNGLVLSTDTGFSRPYGTNPYTKYDSSSQPLLFQGKADPRLPATEHILGINLNGQSVAFSLPILAAGSTDGLTAVNTSVGGKKVAVFWEKGTSSALDTSSIPNGKDVGAAVAYEPKVDGRLLTFKVDGGSIVDEQTSSSWNISGTATSGPLAGMHLQPVISIDSFWFDWAAFHPDTTIYGR